MADDQTHPLYQAVIDAKALLQKTIFERLAAIDSISRDKLQVPLLVEALERIAQTGLEQAAIKKQAPALKRWHQLLETLVYTRNAIEKCQSEISSNLSVLKYVDVSAITLSLV